MSGPTSDTTRSERNRDVQKPRDVTTRKTRAWRRRILFSAAALGLAVLARRLRGRGSKQTADASGTDGDGERAAVTDDASRSTTDDGGRSIGRRLAMAAVSAAVMVVGRRLRERTQ